MSKCECGHERHTKRCNERIYSEGSKYEFFEYCPCTKEESLLARAVKLARGSSEPPSQPVRFSSWENCPLCGSMFIEVNEDPAYKPEAVCTDCGISLQGETVFEIKNKWNNRDFAHRGKVT